MLSLQVFISSPADVGNERAVALVVAERLQLEFKGLIQLKPYLWERSLLRATETFQAQILDIQDADLAIFILWSRVGTPLPIDRFRRPDGSRYNSGTEYEYERARDGYEKNKHPDIICYLKRAAVSLSLRDRERREQQTADLAAIDEFADKWFKNTDGSFKSAFHTFEKTAQFEELLERHLREWILERLHLVSPTLTAETWKGSPFRGLKSFDFDHALIYCGRTSLVSEVLDSLRERAGNNRSFLMVSGMSGVGKSSLVRAGVLPLLMRPKVIENVLAWRRAIYVPNDGQYGLFGGFAAALSDNHALPELVNLPELAERRSSIGELLRDPPTMVSCLTRALDRATQSERERAPDPDVDGVVKLIVVVDQFEEIFDETTTSEERNRFVEALRMMVLTGHVWVVVILRADYFQRCAELPEQFRDLYIDRGGIYVVGGPRSAEIAEMIRRPAMMAGLKFERRLNPEEGLDEVLRDAASGNPTALPLLEFTLDELWERSAGSGTLRFSDYEQLGGLNGALSRRADEVYSALPNLVQAALPRVLSALVHTDATDGHLILQNRVEKDRFSGSVACLALIEEFVDARLMVADRAPEGAAVIGWAHEALLREWLPAVKWIEQNRELLRSRAGIAAGAALWRSRNRRNDRLLTGALLNDAKRMLSERPEMLAPEEQQYVQLSITANARAHKQRSYLTIAAAAVVVAALMLSGSLHWVSYELSTLRVVPLIWSHDQGIPVTDDTVSKLEASIGSLAAHLSVRAKQMGESPELVPWTIAQIWTALYGLDGSLLVQAEQLRQFMTANRDDQCKCWREDRDKPPHSIVTAWVLLSLALYKQPAFPEEIDGVLRRQGPTGWWSMFPSTIDEKNASTSATALTALALHSQLERNLVRQEQRQEVSNAINRAAEWLKKRVLPGRARWTEYPPEQVEDRIDAFAISALTMYALRTVAQITDFDAHWLRELPEVPSLHDKEVAKGFVMGPDRRFFLDDVRHYRYPWMLWATIDAYPRGDIWRKARAVLWIQQALERELKTTDFQLAESQFADWTMAETLFALRHTAIVLKPTTSDVARYVSQKTEINSAP